MNVLISGKVSREPEIKETAKGDKVKFSVAYGKSKYMDCEAWSDSDIGRVAGLLDKGDVISVAGTHRSWEYNDKTYQSVIADMIFTLPQIPTISASAPADKPVAADGFEELDSIDESLPF